MNTAMTIACQKVIYAFRPQGEVVMNFPETTGPQWECAAGTTADEAKHNLSNRIDTFRDKKSLPIRTIAFRMRSGATTIISTTFSDLYARFLGRM